RPLESVAIELLLVIGPEQRNETAAHPRALGEPWIEAHLRVRELEPQLQAAAQRALARLARHVRRDAEAQKLVEAAIDVDVRACDVKRVLVLGADVVGEDERAELDGRLVLAECRSCKKERS